MKSWKFYLIGGTGNVIEHVSLTSVLLTFLFPNPAKKGMWCRRAQWGSCRFIESVASFNHKGSPAHCLSIYSPKPWKTGGTHPLLYR